MSDKPLAPYDGAVQKGAQAVSDVTKASERAGSYLARMFDPAVRELADWSHEIIYNKRQAWRLANAASVGAQLQMRHEEDGGDLRPIPQRLQERLINSVVNEDSATIQRLWVNLLDEATSPSGTYVLSKLHIKLLEDIEPVEAVILKKLAIILQNERDLRADFCIPWQCLGEELFLTEQEIDIYLEHLSTLGCFRADNVEAMLDVSMNQNSYTYIETSKNHFYVTEFVRSTLSVICP